MVSVVHEQDSEVHIHTRCQSIRKQLKHNCAHNGKKGCPNKNDGRKKKEIKQICAQKRSQRIVCQ